MGGKKDLNIARLEISDADQSGKAEETSNISIENVKKNIEYLMKNNIIFNEKIFILNKFIELVPENKKSDFQRKMKEIYNYTAIYVSRMVISLKTLYIKMKRN